MEPKESDALGEPAPASSAEVEKRLELLKADIAAIWYEAGWDETDADMLQSALMRADRLAALARSGGEVPGEEELAAAIEELDCSLMVPKMAFKVARFIRFHVLPGGWKP